MKRFDLPPAGPKLHGVQQVAPRRFPFELPLAVLTPNAHSGVQSSQQFKKPGHKTRLFEWLDETSANGTFYSSHYDTNFNIEEVRGLLDESKEEQDV